MIPMRHICKVFSKILRKRKKSFHFLIWVVVNRVCLFRKSQLKFLLYATETFLNRKTRGFKPGNVNGESCAGRLVSGMERGMSESHEGEKEQDRGGSELDIFLNF